MSNDLEPKWPDYLIQWRTSLWVSIREKESNVWKFITFYATAIALIIGLGEKYTSTFVVAFVIGVLTLWGLAIVIDSNFWMARNLKLIGNIEKLFIPQAEYGKLIPAYYSSPRFLYFRPYRLHFLILSVLAAVAYFNFLYHFLAARESARWYTLPILTALYVIGFWQIQLLDNHTREEYFRFYKSAKGKPIAIGAETLPPEYWDFKLATAATFHLWALLACLVVVISYGLTEWRIWGNRWGLRFAVLILGLQVVYMVISKLLSSKLALVGKRYEDTPVEWTKLCSEPLWWKWTLGGTRSFYSRYVTGYRWLVLVTLLILIGLATLRQLANFKIS